MLIKPSERGQVLVLVVFGIIGLVALVALAVDGGNVFADQRQAQNAADSAAFSSALARIRMQNFVQRAYDSAAQNGYNNDGITNSVQVFSPPVSGAYEGDIEYIQVIINSNVDTYFGGLIGRDIITNRVEAVARTKTPEIKELLGGYAIVSLAPTGDCENHKSFWIHGEATLDMDGGGIFINSNDPECALITQGSGSIRIRDDSPITIVGGASIQKPNNLTPYPPTTGAPQIPFPPPFFLPKIGCGNKQAKIIDENIPIPATEEDAGTSDEQTGDTTNNNGQSGTPPGQASKGGLTMSAGNWSGPFPPKDVTHLESGVYCVEDFIVESQIEGSGVTFVVDGEVRWRNSATIQLTAPMSGDHAGLLIYVPIDNGGDVILNGNEQSEIKGTILAPRSTIKIKGNDSKEGFHSQIIGYRFEVDGNSNIVIKYRDFQNYDALNMPQIELVE